VPSSGSLLTTKYQHAFETQVAINSITKIKSIKILTLQITYINKYGAFHNVLRDYKHL